MIIITMNDSCNKGLCDAIPDILSKIKQLGCLVREFGYIKEVTNKDGDKVMKDPTKCLHQNCFSFPQVAGH